MNCETCKEDLTGLDLEYHYGRNHNCEPSLSEFKMSLREANKMIGDLRVQLEDPPLTFGDCPDIDSCVTYYDGCHCTTGCLKHNIERAEKAESLLAENGMICEAMRRAIRGESLSDFEESFGPVRESLDLMAKLVFERNIRLSRLTEKE